MGELCITAGLVLLLFVAYELWGTGQYTSEQQGVLSKELTKRWAAAPPPAHGTGMSRGGPTTTEQVQFGHGIALIRIPKLGSDYSYVVVEGVTVEDLRKGPGHYPGTALPGGLGNFVVSGHRTTYLAPFNRVDELSAGDKILIDTRDTQYVYQVTGEKVVEPTELDVTDPVPFQPAAAPTQHLITLTTCNPKYSASHRLIVFGKLVQTLSRVSNGGT